MSFDINTGEVLFHARAPDGPSTLVDAFAGFTGFYTGIFPSRAYSVTFMQDPWSQPPPPTGNVLVPLCARGVGAWPVGFESSPLTGGKEYLTELAVLYDANDYPNNGGYRGY